MSAIDIIDGARLNQRFLDHSYSLAFKGFMGRNDITTAVATDG